MASTPKIAFHVFVPWRGSLLFVFLVGLCIGLMLLRDQYIPEFRQEWLVTLAILLVAGFFYWAFGRLAVVAVKAGINEQGLWFDHIPGWGFRKKSDDYIEWNAIQNVVFIKADAFNIHGINWDRFRIHLLNGEVIRFYPVNDFNSNDDFPLFLDLVKAHIVQFNQARNTQMPIIDGYSKSQVKFKALLFLVMAVFFTAATTLSIWIEMHELKPDYFMVVLYVVFLALMVFLVVHSVYTIRKNRVA